MDLFPTKSSVDDGSQMVHCSVVWSKKVFSIKIDIRFEVDMHMACAEGETQKMLCPVLVLMSLLLLVLNSMHDKWMKWIWMFNNWPRCLDYTLDMHVIRIYFSCFKRNATDHSNALALRHLCAFVHDLIYCSWDKNTDI